MKVTRRYLSRKLREEIINQYNGHCANCGATENLHIDHIHPVSRGGSNDPSNLQVLCSGCNLEKADKVGYQPQGRCTTILPGYICTFSIKKGLFPLCSYVGQVQAVDKFGVRITLMDWVMGAFLGFDLFLAWDVIHGDMVMTEEHDHDGDAMAKWQTNIKNAQVVA